MERVDLIGLDGKLIGFCERFDWHLIGFKGGDWFLRVLEGI